MIINGKGNLCNTLNILNTNYKTTQMVSLETGVTFQNSQNRFPMLYNTLLLILNQFLFVICSLHPDWGKRSAAAAVDEY